MAAKLLETARKLPAGPVRHDILKQIGIPRAHHRPEGEGEMTMRTLLNLAAIIGFSASAFAQTGAPKIGGKNFAAPYPQPSPPNRRPQQRQTRIRLLTNSNLQTCLCGHSATARIQSLSWRNVLDNRIGQHISCMALPGEVDWSLQASSARPDFSATASFPYRPATAWTAAPEIRR
jgi:hypothetical protein